MTNRRLLVLINRESGAASAAGDKLPDQVEAAFDKAGGNADVRMLKADEMDRALRTAAKGETRIVVAGGDSTVAAEAQALAKAETELAILPLGTLNHFARDLGIPLQLEAAAELAVHGRSRAVDVGEVNDRRFINNVSVGLYPFMVRGRDDIRERRGWPKWLATLPASWDALSRLRHHRLHIELDRGKQPVVTPLLFVGNNRYSLDTGSFGTRDSLTEGKLAVYVVSRSTRAALLWFGIRALLGRADRERDFAALGDSVGFTVHSSERRVEIALDGEVTHLPLPLSFSILPGVLRVVVPRHDGAQP